MDAAPALDTGPLDTGPLANAALSLTRWTALCAAAEAIGMTAAAVVARLSQSIAGESAGTGERLLALSLVVAGGLVEGVALGSLQAAGLRRLLPRLDGRRWRLVTLLVAGVGWAAASAPAAFSTADASASPPLLLTVGGGAALGVLMGAVLGAAQATGLRSLVSRPGRWTAANALGWAPTMSIIMIGAGTPGADWASWQVGALGTVTGLVAGAALGLVTGSFLPALGGAGPRSAHPARPVSPAVPVARSAGRRSRPR